MPEAVLDPEDAKLVTLARGTRARTSASAGAAVRDDTGRTYAAAAVALPSLNLTALQAAVAIAVASGALAIEAAAVVADRPAADADSLAALRELAGPSIPVHLVRTDGSLQETVST
jgi:hypothetical protein